MSASISRHADRIVRVQAVPPDQIFLWLRRADGTKVRKEVTGFYPHFYAPGKGNFKSLFGEQLEEIRVQNFKIVPEERVKYSRHFQADIPYTRNFLLKTGLKSGVYLPDKEVTHVSEITPAETDVEPRRCYFDIETLGSLDTETTPAPVIAFTAWDSYSKEYTTMIIGKQCTTELKNVIFFKDEKELMHGIADYLQRMEPDMSIGWNVSFDEDYLRNRSKKLGVYISLPTESFDLKMADKKLHSRLSHALKDVALEEGIASKIVEPEDALEHYGHDDIKFMAKYNRDDVEYMVKLDTVGWQHVKTKEWHKPYDITRFFESLKDYAGVAHYSDTLKFSVLDDMMFLRLAHSLKLILPSAPEEENEDEESYKGALVDFFTPDGSTRKGIFEGVAVYDFSRYYPSIIKLINETYKGSNKVLNLAAQLVDQLNAERDKFEKQLIKLEPGTNEYETLKMKRDAVKYLTNSLYGVLAYPRFRLHDKELAAKVTEIGREGLIRAADFVRKHGFEPIYGDTDSTMVVVPLLEIKKLELALNDEITKYFKEKFEIKKCEVKVDTNYYAKRIIFTGVKKRYATHVIQHRGKPSDYLKIVGFETVRTDQSKFTKNFQRKLFELLLRKTREEVIDHVRRALCDFRNQPLETIAFRKGIDKPLNQYGIKKGTGVPSHVRGAIYSNKVFGTNFGAGSKPMYLYVKEIKIEDIEPQTVARLISQKEKLSTDIVAFEYKAPKGCIVDWDRMEKLTLRGKVEKILEAVGIPWTDVEKKQQHTLADFLK